MDKIKELEEAIASKITEKAKIQAELNEKIAELRELKSPNKIGDIVDYKGNKYKITGHTNFWAVGRRIKKDGTPTKNETNLYNLK